MDNNEVKIAVGYILVISDGKYRIIGVKADNVSVCKMDVETLIIGHIKTDDIDINVRNGIWTIVQAQASSVVDRKNLSEKVLTQYEKDVRVLNLIREHYGPGYENLLRDRKENYIAKIRKEYGYNKYPLWKKIRKYLQSGFDNTSLLDGRVLRFRTEKYEAVNGKVHLVEKPNQQRLKEQDLKNFEKFFKEYRSSKYKTYKKAYLEMLNQCYRTKTVTENGVVTYSTLYDDCPSYKQFWHYCSSRLTAEEKDAIEMKKSEQRNNKRLLNSSSMKGVSYPGEVVEIDEFDDIISLVSKDNPDQTVGRPNVYAMIDVLTRVIIGVGVAFNQNAYVGLSNMFINIADDKVEYCKNYGIEIQPEDWPSNIIPATIRVDRGSDFKGNDLLAVCKKLNIERNIVPAATGSLKGIIENSFHLIQSEEREYFENVGLITKDYGSDHHKKAMLDIYDYTKVLLLMVIKHNKRSMDNYKLKDPKMLDASVTPRPYVLWKYFSETVQAPQPIINRDNYLVSLMKEGKASVDRRGIHFLKRTYNIAVNDDPEMAAVRYEQQDRKRYIDILYDPRLMNHIYYLRHGSLIPLYMNPENPENQG